MWAAEVYSFALLCSAAAGLSHCRGDYFSVSAAEIYSFALLCSAAAELSDCRGDYFPV